MKRFLLFLVCSLVSVAAMTQDVRTTQTRVADVLALLPANDPPTAHRLCAELISLGDGGLKLVTSGAKSSGNPEGVPYRYAVALVTQYAATAEAKAVVERAILDAIANEFNKELRTYFIQKLELVGSPRSIDLLARVIQEPPFAEAGVAALEVIGTPEAAALLRAVLPVSAPASRERIIKAMGVMGDTKAVPILTALTRSPNTTLRRQATWSLALIADEASARILLDLAGRAAFRRDSAETMPALLEYMDRLTRKGKTLTATSIRETVLENTMSPDQQHYRLTGARNFVTTRPAESQKWLVKELDRFDDAYRRDVFAIAVLGIQNESAFKAWLTLYKKLKDERQAEILAMLAAGRADAAFADDYLLPGLISRNEFVRLVAVQGLAATRNRKYSDALSGFLLKAAEKQEIEAAKNALMQLADQKQLESLAARSATAPPAVQVAILELIASRRVTAGYPQVVKLTASENRDVKRTAYQALPMVATAESMGELLRLLESAGGDSEIKNVQSAIAAIVNEQNAPMIFGAFPSGKAKLLPVLPYVTGAASLGLVKDSFENGTEAEQLLAFEALTNWKGAEAIPMLLAIRRDEKRSALHVNAFQAYLRHVMRSTLPDDQKLVKLREVMPLAGTAEEKKAVLRSAAGVRTFLSLMFVAAFLDDPALGAVASRSTMRIALPTADAQPGLTGTEVRNVLEKVMSTATGEDSQYDRIDVGSYLEKMSYARGYEPIFNGKDLTGWQGLVENPIARAAMKKSVLAGKQAISDLKIPESWTVKDGMICFTGDGANLCTIRTYKDFEMLVDYRISKNGDSGIYLRGSPQVQIWDISRVTDGAQVGSGGLYNNTVNRDPLVVADNPVGDWNTMRITMVGERVTVYLNGIVVVDNVVMENYWDRKIPIFPEGAIELQAHGTELAFRNLYVRELNATFVLTEEEKKEGYELLFNGRDLSNWVGNKKDYVVEDNCIADYPADKGHGNLFTDKEFSDFVFRFEFQLTPAANNGLGIHAPLEGDAAYVGKELQILDDGHPAYANIKPYQAHGSVYGIIPAKRGFLKPTGEWNYEEVRVTGDRITITLNGTVIVDGDMRQASLKGTLDGQEHPGLNRHRGHIGFLGHGSVVRFRSIRIKDLGK
ncbi:MAG: DUF1080 domain-containing protein [Cytophagales bacterium]|nr:DUF1080 domain-containing protein [Cytophagales bacterium]